MSYDEILRAAVRTYSGAVGPEFLLLNYNARPYVVRVCRQFLNDEGIDAIDWPSCCPDLNPLRTSGALCIRTSKVAM